MTGFSQPPDPDNDPVAAESVAAQPMLPDETHPNQDDLEQAADDRDETDEAGR
ncbi:hypothetical protein [Jatrophihabitans endophyticus]|uniref:hypothetical protein n=1 Tax=Jatrophihabitans endophyticus TaxID=1206085 RepID=UPI0019FA340B|nr:hypothetical protein [Jatrophihabitans endophyticus]MBE7187177.1 hypothetical protein [Jatrophihabitans endophyticus]